ncbi:hypothetical protein [Actinomadura sp. 3N407]|uniref:hypothetical protein n=1 Tax=Actinomadura sp. 3N407 TaxID=3457423 RepID=UPI003FCD6AB8
MDYDIKVPRRTMIDASLAFGRADLKGLSGVVDLKVLIGSATLSDLDGPVTVRTLHDELQAADIRGPTFRARSGGGGIPGGGRCPGASGARPRGCQERPDCDHHDRLRLTDAGVPLTAIAVGTVGLTGFVLTWVCLTMINLGYASRPRRH